GFSIARSPTSTRVQDCRPEGAHGEQFVRQRPPMYVPIAVKFAVSRRGSMPRRDRSWWGRVARASACAPPRVGGCRCAAGLGLALEPVRPCWSVAADVGVTRGVRSACQRHALLSLLAPLPSPAWPAPGSPLAGADPLRSP